MLVASILVLKRVVRLYQSIQYTCINYFWIQNTIIFLMIIHIKNLLLAHLSSNLLNLVKWIPNFSLCSQSTKTARLSTGLGWPE